MPQNAATARICTEGAKCVEVHHVAWTVVVATVVIRMDGLKAAYGPEASHSPNQQKGGASRVVALWPTMGRWQAAANSYPVQSAARSREGPPKVGTASP